MKDKADMYQFIPPDSLRCPREETVSALWEYLQELASKCSQYRRLLHVRATPASGKSTLALLLEEYVRQRNPELSVFRRSWPVKFPESVGPGYESLLNHVFGIPQSHQID